MSPTPIVDVAGTEAIERRARERVCPGRNGAPISASGSGARFAKTTAKTATPGITSRHDQARSRAYRWGEDGLAGISDDKQRLCFALALWNGKRPDPQGAPVRPDQQRGQSRRGREGVLLLSRQHADALVHEVPVQVSAARRFPYGDLVETNRRPQPRTSSNTNCSTPASSTTTATSTCSSNTPRQRRKTC